MRNVLIDAFNYPLTDRQCIHKLHKIIMIHIYMYCVLYVPTLTDRQDFDNLHKMI